MFHNDMFLMLIINVSRLQSPVSGLVSATNIYNIIIFLCMVLLLSFW